ncbi:MAG: hypothetical protein ABW321_18140 [Polyangiales bacterium]
MMRCLFIAMFALLGLAACAAETPGEVVPIVWQLDRDAAGENRDFETDTGFEVHLEMAQLAVAAMYVYSPLPGSVGAIARLSELLPFGAVAHAHGGLDPETGRRVRAEHLAPLVIDLLEPEPQWLPGSEAEAGSVEAAKIVLAESGKGLPADLGGGAVFVRGTARRDGAEGVPFEAAVSLPEAVNARSVDLTGLRETLAEGSVLHIAVHPRVWLRQADFSRLPAAEGGASVHATADDQVGRALAIGVRSPEAFRIHASFERQEVE